MLECGSCSNRTSMSCRTARQHARECAENHITCPLLNSDVVLSRCTQSMNISALWEHCQKFHILEGAPGTMQVKARKSTSNTNNGTLTATVLLSVSFEKNSYFFFTITTDSKSYNMCLHLTKEMPCDAVNPHDQQHPADVVENASIFFVLRRFFPELELSFGTMLLSVEVGPICGMLLRVPAVVSSYEDTTMLKNMPTYDRCQKIVQLPLSLLRQMAAGAQDVSAASHAPSLDPPQLKLAISLQIYFTET